MASRKPLTQLGKDIRAGLGLSMEIAARTITTDLKERGPYWTGQFEAAWEVAAGQVRLESNLPDKSTWEQIKSGPKNFVLTPAFVPPADGQLQGYTIANLMEYADIALDLVPGEDGRYRHQRARSTAKTDWFEQYIRGGDGVRALAISVKQGMQLAGFTR